MVHLGHLGRVVDDSSLSHFFPPVPAPNGFGTSARTHPEPSDWAALPRRGSGPVSDDGVRIRTPQGILESSMVRRLDPFGTLFLLAAKQQETMRTRCAGWLRNCIDSAGVKPF